MKTIQIALLCMFVCGTLADRYTDFAANKAWWTFLTSVYTDTSADRRMCFVGTYDSACDSNLDPWNKVESFLVPTTNAASYSGSVTLYRLCRWLTVSHGYYFFTTGACGPGVSSIATFYLITNPTDWALEFTNGANVYERQDFKVYTNSYADLIVPVGDLPPDPTHYSLKFTFSAYQI